MYITNNKDVSGGYPDLLSLIEGEGINVDNHDNTDEMFHTPNFGEEDFGVPVNSVLGRSVNPNNHQQQQQQQQQQHQLLQQQLQLQSAAGQQQNFNLLSGTQPQSSQQSTLNLPVSSPYSHQVPHNMNARSAGQSNRTDCSILESLESIAPKFPPQNFEVPDISVTNSVDSSSIISSGIPVSQMYGQSRLSTMNTVPLTTISQNDLTSQLGFQTRVKQASPANSTNSTLSPVRESSEDSDDSLPLSQLKKRQVVEETHTEAPKVPVKKQRTPKKRKKKDPNEPQKPVSAYALFFRDTQVAIKGQNPNASFGEVSKIVASMWEGLDPEHKKVYKKKTEQAKKEYLKLLAAYRASLVSQTGMDDTGMGEKSPSPQRQSPKGTSPQHMMTHMTDNMGGFNLNTASPQHLHITSQQHMSSPQRQHMSPQHQHMSPQHQHMSPQHQHMSPPHMNNPHHNMSSPHDSNSLVTMMNYANHHQQQQQMSPLQQKMPMYGSQHDQPQQGNNGRILGAGMCIRNGCTNRAIDNIGWDSEYCSNECVVSHCRDVFTAWVASRQTAVNSFQVK